MVTIDLSRRYKLPRVVSKAAAKGLKLHEAGHSGAGLMPSTVRHASEAARGEGWTEAKIVKASAWFARHESSLVPGSFDAENPKPSGVAWLLWGSDPADGDKGRKWIDEKAAELKAAELGKHSAASTPAKPSERIKGSSKNKPGSAATDGGAVEVSPTVEKALQAKIDAHNDEFKGADKRATLSALKKVYRRGAGAFSVSHRPGMTRGQWAMARVNAFLQLLAKGKPTRKAYITDNDLLPEAHPRSTRGKEMHRKGKKKKKGYMYSKESISLGYKSELVARQADGEPGPGAMRHTVAPGIDVVIVSDDDGQEIIHTVIANADEVTPEGFTEWLESNDYKVEFDEREGAADDSAPNDGKKNYRLDDGSDAGVVHQMFSKPLTSSGLTFEPTTDDNTDLHVLRSGPLFDLEGGEQVLDLSDSQLRDIAETTNKVIASFGALPISFEHGIEAGFRGVPGADRRPYGEITEVYFDEEKRAIFARKQWTKLGREIVQASMMEDQRSALRVSPRVKFTPAHHPETGEVLGEAGYIDVVSITSLPRQPKIERVALSRVDGLDELGEGIQIVNGLNDGGGSADREGQSEKGCDMADNLKADNQADVLLGRGSEEATRVFNAVGLENNAGAIELARRVEDMKTEIENITVELNRHREDAANRERVKLEGEADALLNKVEIEGTERAFYRAALLGDNAEAREFARKAIEEKGRPDQLLKVNEAIEAAKTRGSLAADFALNNETAELARENADVAVKLFEAIPANMVVRVGDAAGVDSAGVEVQAAELSRADAEKELSKIARKLRAEGKAETMVQAWELARKERGDLNAAVIGE